MSISNEASSTPDTVSPTTAAVGVGRFAIAILVGCLLGWVGYTYPPNTWKIPDDMLHIGALSPPADQARLAVVENANLWKNTMLKFSLAGLGIGLSGLILNGARNVGATLLTFVSGPLCGLLGGVVGLYIRKYLDLGHPIPLVSEASRPLLCDSLVFASVSVILILPVAILLRLQPSPQDHHRAYAVPLAGLLTGMLVPLVGAFALPVTTSTSAYPPYGSALTVMWFAVLAGLTVVISTSAGTKNARATAKAELGAA